MRKVLEVPSEMQGALVLVIAVLGLAVGSFLNVVIWRVPRKVSVVRPGSHCPACEAPIRPLDNIPLVSWMALRGRCRNCRAPIPVRYPVVEVGCAALFAAAAIRFGWSAALPAWLVLFAALLAITVIDLEHYIVPNRILLPVTIAALPLLALAVLGEAGVGDYVRGLLGGAVGFGLMLVLNLISPKGMGMGDVKMSFVLGLYLGFLGWAELALGFFLAFLLGAVVGVGLIAVRLRGRKDAVPFGPFLAAGTVITALWGDPVLRWYFGT